MTAPNGRSGDELSQVLAICRFEAATRLRITAALGALFSTFGAVYVWLGPRLVGGQAIKDMLDAMPPLLVDLLGFKNLASLEALLAGEFYTLAWIVGFGAYIAYTASASVAGALESNRMDTVLASPVSRGRVLLGMYLALLVPVVIVNLVVPLALFVGSVVVGDSLDLLDLLILHIRSIPYLLLWGAAGMLLGVIIRGGRRAGRVAAGMVLTLWVFESVIQTTETPWLGALSPVRYFDPHAILVAEKYDLAGATILLTAAAFCLGAAHLWFRRRDL